MWIHTNTRKENTINMGSIDTSWCTGLFYLTLSTLNTRTCWTKHLIGQIWGFLCLVSFHFTIKLSSDLCCLHLSSKNVKTDCQTRMFSLICFPSGACGREVRNTCILVLGTVPHVRRDLCLGWPGRHWGSRSVVPKHGHSFPHLDSVEWKKCATQSTASNPGTPSSRSSPSQGCSPSCWAWTHPGSPPGAKWAAPTPDWRMGWHSHQCKRSAPVTWRPRTMLLAHPAHVFRSEEGRRLLPLGKGTQAPVLQWPGLWGFDAVGGHSSWSSMWQPGSRSYAGCDGKSGCQWSSGNGHEWSAVRDMVRGETLKPWGRRRAQRATSATVAIVFMGPTPSHAARAQTNGDGKPPHVECDLDRGQHRGEWRSNSHGTSWRAVAGGPSKRLENGITDYDVAEYPSSGMAPPSTVALRWCCGQTHHDPHDGHEVQLWWVSQARNPDSYTSTNSPGRAWCHDWRLQDRVGQRVSPELLQSSRCSSLQEFVPQAPTRGSQCGTHFFARQPS